MVVPVGDAADFKTSASSRTRSTLEDASGRESVA